MEIKLANKDYGSLNTKQMANIIKEEVGRPYSIRHIERLMHKLGFSLIKPRPRHIKQDAKKLESFRTEFKKNLNRSIWVMT